MLAPEDVIAMAEKHVEWRVNPTISTESKAVIRAICEYIEMLEKCRIEKEKSNTP